LTVTEAQVECRTLALTARIVNIQRRSLSWLRDAINRGPYNFLADCPYLRVRMWE